MYLSRQDTDNHPSYICYIEAVNEVYYREFGNGWLFRRIFVWKVYAKT